MVEALGPDVPLPYYGTKVRVEAFLCAGAPGAAVAAAIGAATDADAAAAAAAAAAAPDDDDVDSARAEVMTTRVTTMAASVDVASLSPRNRRVTENNNRSATS